MNPPPHTLPPSLPSHPVFVVHGLGHACAALRAGKNAACPIVLLSAPSVTSSAGALWFRHMVDQAQALFSDPPSRVILDCGACSGHAWKAVQDGWKDIVIGGTAMQALQDLARQNGARIVPRPRRACDLSQCDDAEYAARRYVESFVDRSSQSSPVSSPISLPGAGL